MNAKGFIASAIRVDDGGWEHNNILYFIEIKSERESIMPPHNWWKWDKDNLNGQRDYIRNNYKVGNYRELHRNKWMIVIAQLRTYILRLSNINRNYRAIFAIPSVETDNFQQGFSRYHANTTLNTATRSITVKLNIWPSVINYEDQRGIQIQASILEIDYDNYFGQI